MKMIPSGSFTDFLTTRVVTELPFSVLTVSPFLCMASRVGQRVAIGMATGCTATTRLKEDPRPLLATDERHRS